MKSGVLLATTGLIAMLTLCGSAAFTSSHAAEMSTQSQNAASGPGAQAGPSKLPASQADVNAVTGPNMRPDQGKVGNQKAAPSEASAPKATTEAVKQKP